MHYCFNSYYIGNWNCWVIYLFLLWLNYTFIFLTLTTLISNRFVIKRRRSRYTIQSFRQVYKSHSYESEKTKIKHFSHLRKSTKIMWHKSIIQSWCFIRILPLLSIDFIRRMTWIPFSNTNCFISLFIPLVGLWKAPIKIFTKKREKKKSWGKVKVAH